MYKFIKKFYASQYILISLALFCAVLPCFVEFNPVTGARAVFGIVGFTYIVALNILFLRREKTNLNISAKTHANLISLTHNGVDYSLYEGLCSEQKAHKHMELYSNFVGELKDLQRLFLPLNVFDYIVMGLLSVAIILKQIALGEFCFFAVYRLAVFFNFYANSMDVYDYENLADADTG